MPTLTIEFGGLCMFVNRDAEPANALFVLMPDMTGNMSGDSPPHCPMMLVPTLAVGKAALYSLLAEDIDLSSLSEQADHSASQWREIDWALNVSTYTKTRVADCWMTKDKPTHPLAARIRLPQAAKVQPVGPPAVISVDPSGPDHPKWSVNARGRAQVVLEVQTADKTLRIGPATIDMTRGSVTIYMLNIRRCDLNRRKPRPHYHGERLQHQESYYRLLEPCPHGVSGPRFWVDVPPTDTDNSPCGEIGCPTKAELVDFNPPPDISIEWVDTHDCTIGTGT